MIAPVRSMERTKDQGARRDARRDFWLPFRSGSKHHDSTNSPLYFLPLILVFTRWSTGRDRETTQPWEE
jgi:hypothetical protein